MDPVSAVGLVVSTFTLVKVAFKTVQTLDALKEKWDEATLKIISLRTQVETFRVAFNELYEWMNSESWKRRTR